MEIAKQQQAALDVLTTEWAVLAREALARGVACLQSGRRRTAVAEDLAGAAMEGVAVVQAATGPLLSQLAEVAEQAGQVDAALRGVVAWASWRLLAWMIAAVMAPVLGEWLATTLVLWWNTGAIAAPRVITPPGQEAGNGNVSPSSSGATHVGRLFQFVV